MRIGGGANKVIPGLGHSKVKDVKTPSTKAFDIAKSFLLTDVDAFARFIQADYTQPPLARKIVANKARKRFNFSAEAIPFMGRDDELSSISEMLDPAQAIFRWSVIHGSGGIGKSRLAHELCKRTEGEWYAGALDIWFVAWVPRGGDA